jgi:hypothetical protein
MESVKPGDDTLEFTNLLVIKMHPKLFMERHHPPYTKDIILALERVETTVAKKLEQDIKILKMDCH